MLQTVEGASKEISNMLVRMKELAVQANSETYSTTDTDALNLEYQALLTEITRVQANTKWNGMALMDNAAAGTANTVSVQLGDSAKDVTIKDWSITGVGSVLTGLTGTAITDTTRAAATTKAAAAITALDTAITAATTEQATYGSEIASLTHAADNLTNVAQNTDQSRSRIQDADYAVETTNLARTQIIAQASTAMLAQANQSKQSVLALLQ
jgi:flagellin